MRIKIILKILSLSLCIKSASSNALCEEISLNDFDKYISANKISHLIFFSSWCSDCKKELLDNKDKLNDKYILINTFDSIGKGDIALNSLGINHSCFYDKSRVIAKKYNVKFVPKEIRIP